MELTSPASLHPVIDPDICIGSGWCLSACPEGKFLDLVDGVATLIGASNCIGHGRCACQCPVERDPAGVRVGRARRGSARGGRLSSKPADRGSTSSGSSGGWACIKNALTQGLQVAARLSLTMSRPRAAGVTNVAIVGAGPAGIATAVGAEPPPAVFEVLEQDRWEGRSRSIPARSWS